MSNNGSCTVSLVFSTTLSFYLPADVKVPIIIIIILIFYIGYKEHRKVGTGEVRNI